MPKGKHVGFQALLWATVINLILFGLFLTRATPVYETNNDSMMQMMASGFYTGHPGAHLVFTNISGLGPGATGVLASVAKHPLERHPDDSSGVL